jgi:hypothetical protein
MRRISGVTSAAGEGTAARRVLVAGSASGAGGATIA